jgi:RimJ/RimL family protein N-acetyltransferase
MPDTPGSRAALLASSEGQTYLIGEWIFLRPVAPADADVVMSWTASRFPLAPERARADIDAGQAGVDGGPHRRAVVIFAACLREGDDLIGFVSAMDIDSIHRHAMTASEIIDPDRRGQGYGSEARHLMFDDRFNTLGLHMVVSWVMFENPRSAAALRKQGHEPAGRISWLLPRDGGFTSMQTFDLLADAWRAMPRNPTGAWTS